MNIFWGILAIIAFLMIWEIDVEIGKVRDTVYKIERWNRMNSKNMTDSEKDYAEGKVS